MSLFRKPDMVRHNLRTNQTFHIPITTSHIITIVNNEDLDIRRYVSYVLDKLNLQKRHPFAPLKNILTETQKGSYTVEAAVILPVFISLMAGIMMFFWIIIIQFGTGFSINTVVRQYAITGKDPDLAELAAGCSASIINNKVPLTYITGKYLGLDYSSSSYENDCIDIALKYSIKIPMILLGTHVIKVEQHAYARCWTGYDPTEETETDEDVYVTDRGVAYHKSLSCPYLDLSIQTIARKDIRSQKNKSDGRYHACEYCDDGSSEYVYITDYGDCYHSSLSCSGLKRSVRTIKRSEASAYHACGKCAS